MSGLSGKRLNYRVFSRGAARGKGTFCTLYHAAARVVHMPDVASNPCVKIVALDVRGIGCAGVRGWEVKAPEEREWGTSNGEARAGEYCAGNETGDS